MLVRLVSVIVAAFLCGWLMDRLRQPAIVGYILAGVVLGPHFLGLVPYGGGFDLMGQLGLMFLLFFIGSEVQLKQLLSTWPWFPCLSPLASLPAIPVRALCFQAR
jgi:CPA2 family monovalent cation:H+ antiporter-2